MTLMEHPTWQPGADAATAEIFGALCRRPWLVAGRDDPAIEAVRLHEQGLRVLTDSLGWTLVVGAGFVRLRKSPPSRPEVWIRSAPSPLVSSWFFLLIAAADSLAPRVGLNQLVSAARAAAAEAGLPVTGEIHERRAIVAALKELDGRGVITPVEGRWAGDPEPGSDGPAEEFLAEGRTTVQLVIHHVRLAHVLGRSGSRIDPTRDPEGWLRDARAEDDPGRRVRRRLVDDTCVLHDDLDPQESQWLARSADGPGPGGHAGAYGLALEWRAEGAAYVLPDASRQRDAGPGYDQGTASFPASGTVAHAALLIMDQLAAHGSRADGPGPGWRTMTAAEVLAQLRRLATERAAGRGGWRADLVAEPGQLQNEVALLLESVNLLRRQPADDLDPSAELWHLSPAAGRWARADLDGDDD